MSLTRRQFCALVGASALAACSGETTQPQATGEPSAEDALLIEGLGAYFDQLEGADAFGEVLLETEPASNGRTALLQYFRDLPGLGNPAELTQEQLRERLQEVIVADYAAQRVLHIEGWVISRTEANLSALLAQS